VALALMSTLGTILPSFSGDSQLEPAPKYAADRRKSRKRESERQGNEKAEHRALYFDIGEGLLELGLVLFSCIFGAKCFPGLRHTRRGRHGPGYHGFHALRSWQLQSSLHGDGGLGWGRAGIPRIEPVQMIYWRWSSATIK